jgi:putative ABC transport system ATP-binding protein
MGDLSLSLEPGEFVVLVGANGAGKTTLFEIIAGRIRPDAGRILLNGVDITGIPAHRRSRCVTLVSQQRGAGLPQAMTIYEVMRLTAETCGAESDARSIAAKLDALEPGLSRILENQVRYVSGGEYQLVCLAVAALLCEANRGNEHVLLLDEHVSQLAPGARDRVLGATRKLVETRQLTTILATHSPSVAVSVGTRQVVLAGGMVAADLKAEKRLRDYEMLREFLKEIERKDMEH